jgi:hypothetical protein
MAGYSSIWVKINKPEEDMAFLKQAYNPKAQLPDKIRFACAVVNADGDEVPTTLLKQLSLRFTESLFMSVQTVVDFFLYAHWQNGLMVREISYCADAGWYDLQGEKEAWESELFTDEERLRQLSYLDLERLASRPSEVNEYKNALKSAAQIETVWIGRQLYPEAFYPMATASELYFLVRQTLQLADPYV